MINKFLVALLLLISVQGLAQTGTIKGVVLDNRTYERLPFASVYINYTTLGTSADGNGEFTLRNIPLGQHELIVAFVGHRPYQAKITIRDTTAKVMTIRLIPNELREVKVHAKRDKVWERQYEKFKKLFLGTSMHAVRCEILNPGILDFKNDNKGYFIASSNDILQVENYSLGYTLFYEIKNFKVGSSDYLIEGNVRFKPMETSDTATMSRWTKNRHEVYWGSSRELFKSIIERNISEQGYELYKDDTHSADIIRMANFLANIGREISDYNIGDLAYKEVEPNQFRIKFPQRLEVHYLNRPDEPKIYRNVTHAVSWVEVKDDYLIISSEGIVSNPSQMFLSGNMAEARMAELLPYDFRPTQTRSLVKGSDAVVRHKPVNSLYYLLERPYLHTDKPYYYPNEMIWFKGYMKYAAPVLGDSLSRVLYVELIDTADHVVTRKLLHIEKGNAHGNLIVPPSVVGGDYILRAYTRWMLNFDPSLIFSKPVKILEYSEMAKSVSYNDAIDSLNALTIQVEKDTFHTREKIKLVLGVKDLIENFVPASFSVSVTDFSQVVPAPNEGTILTGFTIPSIPLPDSLSSQGEFPVQYGIDFKGEFFTKKGKPTQGLLTVAQENTAQIFTTTTAENGKFFLPNLRLYDSAKLSILAKTINGRGGKVTLDSTFFFPPVQSIEPLKLEIYKSENPSRNNTWDKISDARILEEVTIESTPLEYEKKSSILVSPDYSVSGQWLRDQNTTDVLMSLQSRVPGLRVINGILRLGPPSAFQVANAADGEPLVLIDGVPVNGFSEFSEGTASLISNLSPQEIDRIEVLKFGNTAAYGSRGANGVIVITTRKGGGVNNRARDDKGRFEDIKVRGFSATDKFRAPNYSVASDAPARPDFRATIYWNANVATNAENTGEVSFHAADIPTKYRIVVEGITKDGKVVHGERLVTIE